MLLPSQRSATHIVDVLEKPLTEGGGTAVSAGRFAVRFSCKPPAPPQPQQAGAEAGAEAGEAAPPDELHAELRKHFRHGAFLPHQERVVRQVLEAQRDVLFVAHTAAGKSLCYQLPALIAPAGMVTLVVSPLVALMQNQVELSLTRTPTPNPNANPAPNLDPNPNPTPNPTPSPTLT